MNTNKIKLDRYGFPKAKKDARGCLADIFKAALVLIALCVVIGVTRSFIDPMIFG